MVKIRDIVLGCLFFVFSCSLVNGQEKANKVEKRYEKFSSTNGDFQSHFSDSLMLIKFNRDLTHQEISLINPKRKFSARDFIIRINSELTVTAGSVYSIKANSLWKASDNLTAQWDKNNLKKKLQIKLLFRDQFREIPVYLKTYELSSLDYANKIITLFLPLKDLELILDHKEIIFADITQTAREEIAINNLDLSGIAASTVQSIQPGIDGKSVTISIKEGKFDEGDLDLLGKIIPPILSTQPVTTHATQMATIALGTGNSFIRGRGVAPAAFVTTSDFKNLMPDNISALNLSKVNVQNHSYGVAVENFYGIEAAAYDEQIFTCDTMVHVFSAGNSGNVSPTSGIYQNMPNFANLTGNFKQAKNALVIGAINREDIIKSEGSRGPAYDGRVKPDLVATGEDGTSGAAALTSGVVALLQQKFKDTFAKQPSAALIKSVLVNSADDIGRPQVDYFSGFGRVNALQAVNTIAENRFKEAEVFEGQVFSIPLQIPVGVANVKLTLAWNDPPGTVNSFKSIINHLDLSLEMPNGQNILPWVLSDYPNPDSLNRQAVRAIDNLNNVQQVSLENPIAGNYVIHVKGRRVAQVSQRFFVAYQFLNQNQFSWIYPEKDDHVLSNQINYIRWYNSFYGKRGKLSISYDNGTTWNVLSSNITSNANFFKLSAGNLFTRAILKMEIDGNEFKSNSFVISSSPELEVSYNCQDKIQLHWKQKKEAQNYTVYNIRDNKLKEIATTKDTLITIDKAIIGSRYFAMCANGKDFNGLRSYTIDYLKQGVMCYTRSFTAEVRNNTVKLDLLIGSTHNLKNIIWEKQTGIDIFSKLHEADIKNNTLSYTFLDADPKVGIQRYRATFVTIDGQKIQTEILTVTFLKENDVVIYPNPVRSEVNVLNGAKDSYVFTLFNLLGQKVFNETGVGNRQFNISRLSSGMYIALVSRNGIIVKKEKLIKF